MFSLSTAEFTGSSGRLASKVVGMAVNARLRDGAAGVDAAAGDPMIEVSSVWSGLSIWKLSSVPRCWFNDEDDSG